MYGLRTVQGVIDVRCPELRGIRLAASRRFVMNGIFNRSFFSVHFTEVVHFLEGLL